MADLPPYDFDSPDKRPPAPTNDQREGQAVPYDFGREAPPSTQLDSIGVEVPPISSPVPAGSPVGSDLTPEEARPPRVESPPSTPPPPAAPVLLPLDLPAFPPRISASPSPETTAPAGPETRPPVEAPVPPPPPPPVSIAASSPPPEPLPSLSQPAVSPPSRNEVSSRQFVSAAPSSPPSAPSRQPGAPQATTDESAATPIASASPTAYGPGIFTRTERPPLNSIFFPAAVVSVTLTVAAHGFSLPDQDAGYIAIAALVLALLGFGLAWTFPASLPDGFIRFYNAVTRRTGCRSLEVWLMGLMAFYLGLWLPLRGASPSFFPWGLTVAVISLVGLVFSYRQPLVLWPVGWEPNEAPSAESRGQNTELARFQWMTERGLGVRSTVENSFEIEFDLDRVEMSDAQASRRSRSAGDWKQSAQAMLDGGVTEEVKRLAFYMVQRGREQQFSDYEHLCNLVTLMQTQIDEERADDGDRDTWRSPVRSLRDRVGRSADRALLAAALLRESGRGCMLLWDPKTRFMAVAAAGAAGFPGISPVRDDDGRLYFFLTTAGRGTWKPGDMPDALAKISWERWVVPLRPVSAQT